MSPVPAAAEPERRTGGLLQLQTLARDYAEHRFLFIPGATVRDILWQLGASVEEIAQLASSNELLTSDPTLPFRKSRNGRYLVDSREILRLERSGFVLSNAEDFVRHDSGTLRFFDEIEPGLQGNSAFHALMRMKRMIVGNTGTKARPGLDYESEDAICTVFQLRTISSGGVTGEPAAEGVHSDGVDHTMTTFLGSENMRLDSAVTRLHALQERSGINWRDASVNHVIRTFQHLDLLDTLLLVDSEIKHSVSELNQELEEKSATRDMLVFFTRRKAAPGHVAYEHESLTPHAQYPLQILIEE